LTKPIPKIYATRFFQLVTSRQFAEAERILERVKQKMHVSERNRGYFQALYGMLQTQKNTDRHAFLPSLDVTNKKQLKKYRKEFLNHVESRLHDEYDRGFFEAWADYMKILPKIEAPATPVFNNTNKKATTEQKEAEATEAKTEEETETTIEIKDRETAVESKKEKEPPTASGQSLLVDFAE